MYVYPGDLVYANIFNYNNGQWIQMANMREARREHACGLVSDGTTDHNGEVVVAGGLGYNDDGTNDDTRLSSVEIFSLTDEVRRVSRKCW